MQTFQVAGSTHQTPCASGGPQATQRAVAKAHAVFDKASTGSTGHVRKREMAPPLSVWSLSALGTCGRAAAGGGAGGGATDDCQLRWGDTRPVALYGSMSRASMAAMLG